VRFTAGEEVIAESSRARLLSETGLPNRFYVPLEDVRAVLSDSEKRTHCPYKGDASYYSLRLGEKVVPDALWYYPKPNEAVAGITGHAAFYPSRVDAIEVHRAS
jgi:uncharacterized protein (DUF427 family)